MVVKIIVDNQEIEVNKEGNLIDELARHNIKIPHFCYHKELGVAGNCRMCLVEIKGQKRPQIACNTPIKEGMEILTQSKLTKSVQKSIMELELINHPLDCPICDQAGECSLQDYYMEFDLNKSRVLDSEKVSKTKKLDYGSNVIHDQERCIACARCIRFTKFYTKTQELGFGKRGDETRVIIFGENKINNRYAGNIVQICPVGAMTNSDFRFKQRVWDLEPVEAICQKCSRGCNIYIDHYQKKYEKDKIFRIRARENSLVNGSFICDDGRYSYKLEESNRAKKYILDRREIDLNRAIDEVKILLDSKKIIFLISPSLPLEDMITLKSISERFNIPINAYSDSLLSEDEDKLLIKSDKSSNRASLKLLNITDSLRELKEGIKDSDVIFTFCTAELFEEPLRDLIETKEIVEFVTHNSSTESLLSIPVASFSEQNGFYVNFENIVQESKKAIDSDFVTIREFLKLALNLDISNVRELIRAKLETKEVKWM